ncbi:VOC family protein [Dermacoccaceae bacterium W4C1]
MRLENLSWDARDPQRLGRFWAQALGARVTYSDADLLEARIDLGQEQFLDLTFGRVDAPAEVPQRLHPDLLGGQDQAAVVTRLESLGARRIDIGQRDAPWVVLADPEGNAFCVMEHRAEYARGSGPIASLPLDSADPERDGAFWAALIGWRPVAGYAPVSLRHPLGVGPLLELCPEPGPRQGKSTLHLDVRPDPGQGFDPVQRLLDLGGTVLEQPAPGLSWTVCADPSGNEICLLGVN